MLKNKLKRKKRKRIFTTISIFGFNVIHKKSALIISGYVTQELLRELSCKFHPEGSRMET